MKRASNVIQKMLDQAKRYAPLYTFLALLVAIFTAFATIDPTGTPLESAESQIRVSAYFCIATCLLIGLLSFFVPFLQKLSQWLRNHLLQVFGFLALTLLALSIYLSPPRALVALEVGLLISGIGIGAGIALRHALPVRKSPKMAKAADTQADLRLLRERFREVIALQHQVDMLLPRVRDGLGPVDTKSGFTALRVRTASKSCYDRLRTAYQRWELKTEELLGEYAPEHVERFISGRQRICDFVYLSSTCPPDSEQWFHEIENSLGEIAVLIQELREKLTVSIPAELPYDFMEHFYDPSTERQADSPEHIRLLEKAECSGTPYPAIFEHPPKHGDAILTYRLRGLPLPPARFRLSFRYGVVDRLYEEPSGSLIGESDFLEVEGNQVVFSIRIDGKEIFRSPQFGHEWSPPIGEGPLEAPHGDLTVEFRTNAMGEPTGNWAVGASQS
jgi:hypothetical protein